MSDPKATWLERCPVCHNKLEATVPFFLDVTTLWITEGGATSIDAWSPMGSLTIEEAGDFDSPDVRVYCPNDHTVQQMVEALHRTKGWGKEKP